MLKIINFIITKYEKRLSKKNNCIGLKDIKNEEIKLYRDILNTIDVYMAKKEKILILRHYRYIEFEVDDIKEK